MASKRGKTAERPHTTTRTDLGTTTRYARADQPRRYRLSPQRSASVTRGATRTRAISRQATKTQALTEDVDNRDTRRKQAASLKKAIKEVPEAEAPLRALYPDAAVTGVLPGDTVATTAEEDTSEEVEEKEHQEAPQSLQMVFYIGLLFMLAVCSALLISFLSSMGKDETESIADTTGPHGGSGGSDGGGHGKPATAMNEDIGTSSTTEYGYEHDGNGNSDGRTDVVCMVTPLPDDSRHWYGDNFPYEYCTQVIFCCGTLYKRLQGTNEMERMAVLAREHANVTAVGIIVDDDTTAESHGMVRTMYGLEEALHDPHDFVNIMKNFTDKYKYDRVYYLYRHPRNYTHVMAQGLKRLKEELQAHVGITHGMVGLIELQEMDAYPLQSIGSLLEEHSFLLLKEYTDWRLARMFYSKFTIDIIEAYVKRHGGKEYHSMRSRICVMLSPEVERYEVSGVDIYNISQDTRSSNYPIEEDESPCQEYSCRTTPTPFFDGSLCEDHRRWLFTIHVGRYHVHNFLCEIWRRTKITCFGVSRTEADDIDNRCRYGRYPTLRAVYDWNPGVCVSDVCKNSARTGFPC
ncbi:uncharacterized protein LOC135398290 [Ornithodoros turicata]|uniref:uncharacterized protein LOC135398290 n=1 Tax=Ornithodoros turicata TaxID=34597 RepID=UPI003139CFA9